MKYKDEFIELVNQQLEPILQFVTINVEPDDAPFEAPEGMTWVELILSVAEKEYCKAVPVNFDNYSDVTEKAFYTNLIVREAYIKATVDYFSYWCPLEDKEEIEDISVEPEKDKEQIDVSFNK